MSGATIGCLVALVGMRGAPGAQKHSCGDVAPPEVVVPSGQMAHSYLGETGPLSQGVQARRKALRIRHINGTEVRKKRPRGFKKRPRGFK